VHIEKLELKQFKNHTSYQEEFVAGVNALVGLNGSGKTNILDALHFLSTGKSFFFRKDSLCIKHECSWATVDAKLSKDHNAEKWHIGISESEKRIQINGTRLKSLSSHLGAFPVVFINPDSTSIIKNYQEDRLKMVNKTLSQVNQEHLQDLMKFRKVLENRNALLKRFFEERRFDPLELEAIDHQLLPLMQRIHAHRMQEIPVWMTEAQKIYEVITNSKEILNCSYQSDLLNVQYMAEWLTAQRNQDLSAKRTQKGAHKDDLELTLDGKSLKKYGSQGQIKAATIALLLGSLVYLKRNGETTPMLLLDDAFEKIDEERMKRLLQFLDDLQGVQIFITDTDLNRVKRNLQSISSPKKIVNIEAK
jgi:DNA replication and repair protein RecF